MSGIVNIFQAASLFVVGEKRGKQCPQDLPCKVNGESKSRGEWLVELFDENRSRISLSFPDINNRRDAERRLSLLIADRERGQLNLPQKRDIPTLVEYSKKYLSLYTTAKETTRKKKSATIKPLVKLLGNYRLDRITPFIIEKYRIDSTKKGKVGSSTVNDETATLTHLFNRAIKEG